MHEGPEEVQGGWEGMKRLTEFRLKLLAFLAGCRVDCYRLLGVGANIQLNGI